MAAWGIGGGVGGDVGSGGGWWAGSTWEASGEGGTEGSGRGGGNDGSAGVGLCARPGAVCAVGTDGGVGRFVGAVAVGDEEGPSVGGWAWKDTVEAAAAGGAACEGEACDGGGRGVRMHFVHMLGEGTTVFEEEG